MSIKDKTFFKTIDLKSYPVQENHCIGDSFAIDTKTALKLRYLYNHLYHFKKLIDVWSLEDQKIRENKTEYIEIIETLDREYSVYGLNWQENRGISQLVNYQDSYLKMFDPQAPQMSLQDGSSLTKNVRKWKNGLELTRNYTMYQKVSDEDPLPEIYLNDVEQPLVEIILFPDSGKV